MRIRIETGTHLEWGGSFPLLHCPSLSPFPSWKGSSCSQGAPTVKNSIPNRVQIPRIDLFSSPKPFLSLQHYQDTTGGTPRTLQGQEELEELEFPFFPDLGFSAAETEHFLTGHVKQEKGSVHKSLLQFSWALEAATNPILEHSL